MKFFQVTMTTAATAYNLRTLLRAAYPSGAGKFVDGFRQIIIQSQASGYVRIGASNVSATVYGVNLSTLGTSISLNGPSLGDTVFVLSENAAQKLGITVVY